MSGWRGNSEQQNKTKKNYISLYSDSRDHSWAPIKIIAKYWKEKEKGEENRR